MNNFHRELKDMGSSAAEALVRFFDLIADSRVLISLVSCVGDDCCVSDDID